jgi:DNA-binding CsgD family transcriptional regulator
VGVTGTGSKVAEKTQARTRRRGPRLVGRERELSLLEAELERSKADGLRCAVLVGEQGVGKTRLAREFAERHARSAINLSARAYPLATATSFGLWADGLEPLLRGFSPSDVVRLCGGFVDDLSGLLNSVASVRGSAPATEPPRLRLLEALARVISTLAQQLPLIAVLDDAHLADSSSWEVLRYLARHLAGTRMLVVATARAAVLAHHEVASQVLFELEQDGLASRIELRRLDRHALEGLAVALLQRPAPEALVDWLLERSRGNALFAISLVRALLEEGANLSAPRLERLPESLTQRAVSQLRQLDEAQRETLEVLAVLGSRAEFADLPALTGRLPAELQTVLAGLVSAQLVDEEETTRELIYDIQHPLVREAVYQSIGGARRRILHQRLGRALRSVGRFSEAALHFARSATQGDQEAIATLLEAVRQAEQRETQREALELLAAVVELLPAGDPRWLNVYDAISWRAEWVVDHRADAHTQTAIRAMRAIDALLVSSPDATRRARVKFRLASFLAWGTGDLNEAEPMCVQAVSLLKAAGEEREGLLAARELAWIRGLRGDFAGMEADARRVAGSAEVGGERFVLMQGLAALGWAASFQGRFHQAEAALTQALAIASEDQKTYRVTAILTLLALVRAREGRGNEALNLLRQAKDGNPAYRETVLPEGEVQTQWVIGNFTAAVNAARESVAWSPGGVSLRRTHGMAFGALAAAETIEIAEGRRFLARARAALQDRDLPRHQQLYRYADGILAWHEGPRSGTLFGLAEVASRLRDIGAMMDLPDVLLDLAEVSVEAGELATALAAAAELDGLAARLDRDRYRALAAVAGGWASLASGDTSGAAARARSAVTLLAEGSCHGLLARALEVLGRSLSGSDRSEAVEALKQAASVSISCGATWRRERIIEAMRPLGSGGQRAAAAAMGAASLTMREREVARLAAEGHPAREIARRLFLSERTVETHLTRVYAKLGVASKVELVRRAPELTL